MMRKSSAKTKRRLTFYIIRILPLLFLFLIVAGVICTVVSCSASREPDGAQSEILTNADDLQIIQQFAVNNDCYRSGRTIEVKGLMLHSVGSSQPSAKIYADNFNTSQPNGREVCPHAFLQADGTVYQILPWDLYGWHAGGTANRTHIGIEMCEPDTIVYDGPTTFYTTDEAAAKSYAEDTYLTAVRLFARLCIAYELDPLEEGVIISHAEGSAQGSASDHSDPEHLWNGLDLPYTMDTFRTDVAAQMEILQ